MDLELFLQRHGPVWESLKRDPLYTDLIDLLRTYDPSRAMPLVPAKDLTEHSVSLISRIAGFNLALNALTSIAVAPVHEPARETWGEMEHEPEPLKE